jgi:hypothetical protein
MAGGGILTAFPFGSGHARARGALTFRLFALALGPTHPRPIAVLAEPFPTSAFKVLI